jgi:hypothetical protein
MPDLSGGVEVSSRRTAQWDPQRQGLGFENGQFINMAFNNNQTFPTQSFPELRTNKSAFSYIPPYALILTWLYAHPEKWGQGVRRTALAVCIVRRLGKKPPQCSMDDRLPLRILIRSKLPQLSL